MVRKQLYIDDAHEAELKRRAAESGLTEAEIVRQALDQHLLTRSGAEPRGRGAAAEALDHHADTFVERLRERRTDRAGDGRGWTRDELYADREAQAVRS